MNKQIIPKVILHEHVEGSITPFMAKKLADKNHLTFPESLCYRSEECRVGKEC